MAVGTLSDISVRVRVGDAFDFLQMTQNPNKDGGPKGPGGEG